ncbi:MAG: PilT/PilU family type 4a pilus ATPase [Gammaproteobacteria bacterium]|nr:PilT/PilU family type 4a pilus ATPase [Gammaproteobacteria bacterium]MDH5630904.1 PilT/PilU family type 4a pilus ATPase [Gammaproteobacteria bacterium]
MDIKLLLRLMSSKNASDLFFSAGAPPHMKIEGISTPMGQGAMPAGSIKKIAYELMNEKQIKEFEEEWEQNFAITIDDIGRFRVNVFMQRGEVGMVMRHIKSNVPSLEELELPNKVAELVMERSGLVLVCGPTGSGKSTTLAAMIDYKNRNATSHILTLEDPIEFIHTHKQSIIDQREIGVDTKNFHNGLKNAMREAPDVILIGEVRDEESMQYAISYAQTGHLCIATIHGNNSKQVIERIRNLIPNEMRDSVLKDLSSVLKGIISQRLVMSKSGKRVAAMEIMLKAPDIQEIIQTGNLVNLKKAIEKHHMDGMMSFDQSLFKLYKTDVISKEEALHFAESRTDLNLQMRLSETGGKMQQPSVEGSSNGPSFSTKL